MQDHIMFAGHTILVLGATGQQGGSVARALRADGWSVRALVRNPDTADAHALADLGCTLAVGDQADRASIDRAIAGAYGVFSVQPSSGQSNASITDEDEIGYAMTVAAAAQAAGVRHFVQTSVIAAGRGSTGLAHFDSKAVIEERLGSMSMPITIVRPATFMELLMLPGMGLDRGVMTFLMRSDQQMQFIAVLDIGRIVTAVFADPDHFSGNTISIASDAVAGDQLATALSRAAGQSITYERFPESVLAENVVLSGAAALIDDGRLAGDADITALRKLVPELYNFDTWLAGPGAPLLKAARGADKADVALR